MSENPEEAVRSTNPKFPGYAKRQDEREWLVYRTDDQQVGLMMETDIHGVFDVLSLHRSEPVEVQGFQAALAYCLENFRPHPL